ncbi:MAG: glycoside hydrolase [Planctomycetes bacterium]|nr:glycoside hydrolase [Planctomycetota bacterium]
MPSAPTILRQVDLWFDPAMYTAFPHVIRLDGDELLMSFRQAPATSMIHHTHPRSIITVARSYDLGETWDMANATQAAAGGGQELGLLHLGKGRVVGALAWHNVVHEREQQRTGLNNAEGEYRYGTSGTLWAWSDDWGLSWPTHQTRFLGAGSMPCAAPIRLYDGALLCPAYAFDGSAATMDSIAYRSADGGANWSRPVVVAAHHAGGGMCEPSVVETAPGKLRALHRAETSSWDLTRAFWSNRSNDNGATWSAPRPTGIQSGACPRLFNLADGRLLLTFGRRFAPCGIYAAVSDDGGETWPHGPWLLRPSPDSDQGYTSTVELSPGNLLTVSYGRNPVHVAGIIGTHWRLP